MAHRGDEFHTVLRVDTLQHRLEGNDTISVVAQRSESFLAMFADHGRVIVVQDGHVQLHQDPLRFSV
jgi:hypothetical protein